MESKEKTGGRKRGSEKAVSERVRGETGKRFKQLTLGPGLATVLQPYRRRCTESAADLPLFFSALALFGIEASIRPSNPFHSISEEK